MRANPLHEFLQWFGLLGAALAWTGQFVVGMGMSFATCNVAGQHWGIDQTSWEIALTAAAATIAVLSEAAAVWLFVLLKEHGNEPPGGRHVFFAYAAVPANLIFLAIILGTGVMSLYHLPCRQALGGLL